MIRPGLECHGSDWDIYEKLTKIQILKSVIERSHKMLCGVRVVGDIMRSLVRSLPLDFNLLHVSKSALGITQVKVGIS